MIVDTFSEKIFIDPGWPPENPPPVAGISTYSLKMIKYLKEISKSTRLLWSPNITGGINFLIIAAKVLKKIAPYADIEIIEEHFKQKPEVSGTAKIISRHLELNEEEIKTHTCWWNNRTT